MATNRTRFCLILLGIFSTIKQSKTGETGTVDSWCFPSGPLKKYYNWESTDVFYSNITYGGKCSRGSNCICVGNYGDVAMLCKEVLDARASTSQSIYSGDEWTHIQIDCNKTAELNLSQIDFQSNLRLTEDVLYFVDFSSCPEPLEPYSSLLGPRNNSNEPHKSYYIPVIEKLSITCEPRMEFAVDKMHFLNLQYLKKLWINCKPISKLPEDMFEEMANVEEVKIVNTSIEYLPNNIFLNLTKLRLLDLFNNRIRLISKDTFEGQINLKLLYLQRNLISVVDDDAFKHTKKLQVLALGHNQITRLPNSMHEMKNLEELTIYDNLLTDLQANDCIQFQVSDSSNNLTRESSNVSFQCVPKLIGALSIDFSRNRINKLPENITKVDSIIYFTMSQNYGSSRMILRKFLSSSHLWSLKISNSNVVSVDFDFFSGFPRLRTVDLSLNKIKSLPEGLLAKNPRLVKINLSNNHLTSLPRQLFFNNTYLDAVDLSANLITKLESDLFSNKSHLQTCKLSNNLISDLPRDMLVSQVLKNFDISSNNLTRLDSLSFRNCCRALTILDISNNKMERIEKETFRNLTNLKELNLSNNRITSIEDETFRDLSSIVALRFSDNYLSDFPYTKQSIEPVSTLKELNLNGNRLTIIHMHDAGNIERLYLSRNNITEATLPTHTMIKRLTISYNPLKGLLLPVISDGNMMDVDLSHNNMSFCDSIFFSTFDVFGLHKYSEGKTRCPYKSIDYSHNKIDFDNSPSRIERKTMLWGKTTRLRDCDNIKIYDYSFNSIKDVLLDWRLDPVLELVNLQHNKIKFLKKEDILFDNTKGLQRTCLLQKHDPVKVCERNLTLDLRHNNIRGVELPSMNLSVVPSSCNRTMNHSHASILLDNNPFYCGFGLFNFLRYVEEDVTLVSDVMRVTGENRALPAKIIPGNLTCSSNLTLNECNEIHIDVTAANSERIESKFMHNEPELVKGKIVMEPETYMHQAMPMFGILAFRESYEEDDYEET